MQRERFGVTAQGVPVERCVLSNARGMRVAILTFGAVVASIETPDRQGRMANIVLGLSTLEDYVARSPHFGAVPGRYANRIAKGTFVLDGTRYELPRNDGQNTLHGGPQGFGRRIWEIVGGTAQSLRLRYVSADGEAGFPGKLTTDVTYTVEDENGLRIDYEATTDRPTILNLTNHSYFNLGGEGSGDILGHELEIAADRFTPTDAEQIPTGEIREVAGTPFDFTRPVPIGTRIRLQDAQLVHGLGYDHNYVLRGDGAGGPRFAARLHDQRSGRVLEVWTTEPGLQLYTGNKLNGALIGPS
ncbi:MAG: galactose mutarotase, partial [Alphaproteobacteria bacterium]|nr:galactose mutarotase [Alphaproteobacteria bacterium]